jgi:AAA15 family ATPase/GTPase
LEGLVTERIDTGEIGKQDIIRLLQKADFNISDIVIREEELIFEHRVKQEKYFLRIEQESEGTRRYYGFAGLLALLLKKSTAFPIDELELSLHLELFIHFILSFLLNAKKSQIIATTHNREILDTRYI